MKDKTSITLSREVLAKIDRHAGTKSSRSAFIENVLRKYFSERARAAAQAWDVERFNDAAEQLNAEAAVVLRYQFLADELVGAGVKRGELYRVRKPADDAKSHRVFVVVSRQALIDSKFSSVICAPVFTNGHGLATQVAIGTEQGMKHPSWIMCDNLVSLRKEDLTQYVGSLPPGKLDDLDRALAAALDLG